MKRNTWFRFYSEVIDDPKVQLLPKALRWAWVELLCLASKNDGFLPPIEQIAFSVRASINDAQADVDALILAGLMDVTPEGRITPHNWSERQFVSDSSRDRTRKYRERLKKQPRNDVVTSQVTPQETETESDHSPPLPPAGAMSGDEFNRLRKRLESAAGEALDDPARSASLINPSAVLAWLDGGAHPELDILPAIQSVAAKAKPRSIRSWEYFTRQVAENRARRSAGLPVVRLPADSASDRQLREIAMI